MPEKILIVDDEESIRFTFEVFLSDEGYGVETAQDYEEAVGKLAESEFDLIFADIILKGKSGIDLLRTVRKNDQRLPVIIITGVPTIDTATEAVRLGAFDYLVKPARQDQLLRAARLALQHKTMLAEREKCQSNVEAIFRSVKDGIITVDDSMQIVEINTAAEQLCHLERLTCIGQPVQQILTGCSRACLQALEFAVARREGVELQHIECRTGHGHETKVVSVSAAPLISHPGIFNGGVMVMRDESRLYALERSLQQQRGLEQLVGSSLAIRRIRSMIQNLASVQTTVLITGESGTGKELVANALHYTGERSQGPMVRVNCSALSESLLESELFGHVRGAFTGAVKDKVGRFQKAHGGTLFLDEIGDIPARMQLRLLRVLEGLEFERVGESTPIKVDVRMIAATNRDLKHKVTTGDFREDLYYRLKVVEINIPPLRQRRTDIPLLVQHFVKRFNQKFSKAIKAISAEVEALFGQYSWPGNVRELEHCLEHACILCRQHTIVVDHLPPEFKQQAGTPPLKPPSPKEASEKQSILDVLGQTAWNISQAARLLGISRRNFYRKLRKYNLARPS